MNDDTNDTTPIPYVLTTREPPACEPISEGEDLAQAHAEIARLRARLDRLTETHHSTRLELSHYRRAMHHASQAIGLARPKVFCDYCKPALEVAENRMRAALLVGGMVCPCGGIAIPILEGETRTRTRRLVWCPRCKSLHMHTPGHTSEDAGQSSDMR